MASVLAASIVLLLGIGTFSADGSVADAGTELRGHLQPFGFQRDADYPIDEYSDPFALTGPQFYEQYIATRRPVVFRGAAKHFKAYREWTAEAMTAKYAKLELRIEPRKDGSGKNPIGALGMGRDTVENFMRSHQWSNNYVVSELPTPMYGDAELLPCMSCGALRRSVSEVNLWISGGGTRSRLHRDAFNAINCQINGTKDWIMIPSNQTDNVYFKESSEFEMGGLSPINTDSVDLKKFPRAKDVPWGITTIEAGDCIYIPGGHYHQVRSYGFTNVAVSVLFSRLELEAVQGFKASECDGVVPAFVPLSDIPEILWQYPGSGMMTMGRLDNAMIEHIFFTLSKGKPITKKQMLRNPDFPGSMGIMEPDGTNTVWSLLDTNQDGVLTKSDMQNVSRADWRIVAQIMEPEIVYSNSYDYEYATLDYDVVRSLLRRAFKNRESLTRVDFVTVYTQVVGGSPLFGRQIFEKLDREKKGVVTMSSLKDGRLEEALKPFLVTEEDDGGNHIADGDGDDGGEEGEGEMDPESMLNRMLGKSEIDIENDETLSETERESALESYQERIAEIKEQLGEREEDEEEKEDESYREHLARIKRDSLEDDGVELEELVGDSGEAGNQDNTDSSDSRKTEL